jgi:hypothetical protein
VSAPRRPSGAPPPHTARLNGQDVALLPLAERVAATYDAEYPDERRRYGDAGREWCLHDNLHLLAWAFGGHAGTVDFEAQALWLARVLDSRGYPTARLARDLEICAEVVSGAEIADVAHVAEILHGGAVAVARAYEQAATDTP